MPFIETKLNVGLSTEQEENIKAKLGNAIAILPGKSEYWLMLRFEENCRMWFRGYNNFPIAMVQVNLYGSAESDLTGKLTGEITKILSEELNIKPEHIYVSYAFTDNWGWNGSNF